MISTVTETQLPELVPLFRGLPAHSVPESRGDAAILHRLRAALAGDTRFLVYRTEGVVRGILAWRPHLVPGDPRRIALVDHIHVEPILRRRGIASRLVTRFEEDIAEAFDGWTVEAHAVNAACAALMRRHPMALTPQDAAL
ncbi:GNAT family N-acetyltransferase [Tropicibacter sp. S64]|uniref:GNAT family N-acetyltransferase n=1 Tax=Tropicibacter sp. S64 TaxID=3415122 RepID=UPI003C7BB1D5